MAVPLIGITTGRTTSSRGVPLNSLPEAYLQAVSQAGGTPVMIPLGLGGEQLAQVLRRLDGLVFSGGGDVDPQLYGAESIPELEGVDPDRDRLEVALVEEAIKARLPFLGICRGIQIINVALGGTLYTHIADQLPGALDHELLPGEPRDSLTHAVVVDSNSRLAEILGRDQVQVNSIHHQGVCRLAPGLRATAHAPDGLVEAFEITGHPFGLAVQWHPEWLTAHAPMQALFKALVDAARAVG
jgi:putative glutamine amidotransferase